tara:strand:+ start:13643 stop:14722 length:1080 start_codon:yes stop_codon:yes gene_type:complete
MDQYLEKLEVFYDEKMKYLTKKDKFIKCQTCENGKIFHESKDELILSCGSGKDDKCGPQIKIQLPKYTHYVNRIDELKNDLNDKYNWEILQKYLDVSEEAKNFEENREKINEEIERIEKLYFEKNMALKKEQIQVFYYERINKTKECKEIINKLNDNDNKESKDELRKKYILLVGEINNEYEQIQELLKDMNPFLIDQEPEVTILHNTHEYKKEKKKSSNREFDEILIDKILETFIKNAGFLTKEDYYKIRGKHTTPWGNSLFRHLQNKGERPWKQKEQKKYGDIIEEPKSKDPDRIKLTEQWIKYLIKEFKIGMKVSWIYKEKKKMGVIKELKGKGALVVDERGKEKVRQLNKLMIED